MYRAKKRQNIKSQKIPNLTPKLLSIIIIELKQQNSIRRLSCLFLMFCVSKQIIADDSIEQIALLGQSGNFCVL